MMKQRMLFPAVRVGERFECNGNKWVKVSSRTARIEPYGKVFYFTQHDVCVVEVAS